MSKKSGSNVGTGISTAVGATVGVVAGSVIATEVDAEELKDGVEAIYEGIASGVSHAHSEISAHFNGEETEDVSVEDEEVSTVQDNIDYVEEGPEVEVLAYETVQVDGDLAVDVSVVNIDDDENVLVADVDRDGIADYIAMDVDGDMQLDEDEFLNVSNEGISMTELQDAYESKELYLNDNGLSDSNSDYVNDADVDDFLA